VDASALRNLVPFSAPLNSPDVRDYRAVTFRLKAPEVRRVELAGVAILTALGRETPVPFQKGVNPSVRSPYAVPAVLAAHSRGHFEDMKRLH